MFVYILGRPREHNLITIFTCYVIDVIRRGAFRGEGKFIDGDVTIRLKNVPHPCSGDKAPHGPGLFVYVL